MTNYTARAEQFNKTSNSHSKQAFTFSLLRGASFIAFIIFMILYFNNDQVIWLISGFVSIGLFSSLVGRHRFHEDQKLYYQTLVDINLEELKRTNLVLHDFETGDQFLEENHPNQHDLDVFGSHSLYQLINRSSTQDGQKLIGQWLSNQPTSEEVIEKQEAVKELSKDLDWLQKLQANSRISVRKKKKNEPTLRAANLIDWSTIKTNTGNRTVWFTLIGVLLIGIITTGVFIAIDAIPYQYIYGNILVNAIALGIVARKLSVEIVGADKAQYLVTSYLEVLKVINSKDYQSALPKRLKQALTNPHDAEKAISQLSKISHRISSRANMLYLVVDLLFLIDFFLLMSIYQWKKTNSEHIEEWLQAIHEFEALMSIASFAEQHPTYQYPKLASSIFKLDGKEIGHPLIGKSDRVNNDYFVDGKGSVDIITGSNMSGKSTFQRTLGINLILARIGAPVCASTFEFSNVEVFTSMRTKDNLSENTSSFYAELKRITQLLKTVEDKPTFFLLDEILKGTNSEDRHLGAIALAEKLSTKEAFGLISTHDLALSELEKTNKHVRNYSFNSQIDGSKISFDYTLTPGPCKSFNASQLMRNMGIID
ncbi:MutS-related protein [Marinoscillum pacificum]|uniref:MutS-related protein n=1 Tax=Marinoscillum pacificum TaxID=392723 RepID=UPI002157217B|nr:hypothetical protein [Marinoscillum pacificum]